METPLSAPRRRCCNHPCVLHKLLFLFVVYLFTTLFFNKSTKIEKSQPDFELCPCTVAEITANRLVGDLAVVVASFTAWSKLLYVYHISM